MARPPQNQDPSDRQLSLDDWLRALEAEARQTDEPNAAPTVVDALAEALAPRIARQLAESPPASGAETPTGRLLTLDQLVAELPTAKRPQTWKRWLYERTRRGEIPAASSSAACSSSTGSRRSLGCAPAQPPRIRRQADGTGIDRQTPQRQLRDRLLRRRQAEVGDDRPQPPRSRTRTHRPQTRGRHRHVARAQQRNPHLLRRTLARPPRSSARRRGEDATRALDLRRIP